MMLRKNLARDLEVALGLDPARGGGGELRAVAGDVGGGDEAGGLPALGGVEVGLERPLVLAGGVDHALVAQHVDVGGGAAQQDVLLGGHELFLAGLDRAPRLGGGGVDPARGPERHLGVERGDRAGTLDVAESHPAAAADVGPADGERLRHQLVGAAQGGAGAGELGVGRVGAGERLLQGHGPGRGRPQGGGEGTTGTRPRGRRAGAGAPAAETCMGLGRSPRSVAAQGFDRVESRGASRRIKAETEADGET